MITIKKFIQLLTLILFFHLFLSGCSEDNNTPEVETVAAVDTMVAGCTSCHTTDLDENHRFACISCHAGNEKDGTREGAHEGLIAQPAHPDNGAKYCGGCHEKAVNMVAASNHYRLREHITQVRAAFGAAESPDSAVLLEASAEPENILELTDDLLRRRCLRCHVYSSGDSFDHVSRATGCGACHLSYSAGKMQSHTFLLKPDDARCLSCHYGNHVGFDYYGRYEHDYNEEYRTPYRTATVQTRPFGVESHQLQPDVHQQAGMHCIDCHKSSQVMGGEENNLTCRACHDPDLLQNGLPPGVSMEGEAFSFSSTASDISTPLPVIKHPAHFSMDKISCQACHARWVFNDDRTNLMRIDHDDFDDFYKLSLDGSFEVNTIIGSHVDEDGDLLEPVMTDKFTSQILPGIWFKGYRERRWERFILLRDEAGILTTGRPILDLSLSWIDLDETVRYDNIRPTPTTRLVRPYTPHTIGAAGLFYQERLRQYEGASAK